MPTRARRARPDAVTDVLIVGAGPVGLTLGCELGRRGVGVRIIDSLASPTDQSRATDLQSRTLEILEVMGVLGRFEQAARRVNGVRFHGGGDTLMRLDFAKLDAPHPFLLALPQPVTEGILRERLAALGVPVERPATLAGFEQDEGGVSAEVTLPGGACSVRARWMVGCDGANSAVRRALGRSFAGSAFDESFVVADVELETALPADEIHLFLHRDGFLTVLALPGTRRFRFFFDLPADRGAPPGDAELQAIAAARTHVPMRVRAVHWTSFFRLHQRMVDRYRTGRVFLAGNAAHVHSPAGGQGMNTGIQDAWNLGWKLAMVAEGRAADALLETYHAERFPIGETILAETSLATRSSMIRAYPFAVARNALTRLSGAFEPLVAALSTRCAELDLDYRPNAAVDEQRAPWATAPVVQDRSDERASLSDMLRFGRGPHAGARAPDVGGLLPFEQPGGEAPVALRELLHPAGFTLLLFDGEAVTAAGYENLARVAALAEARLGAWVRVLIAVQGAPRAGGRPGVVFDPEGALHRRYGASGECLYLIRPDRHVGFRCQPADAAALGAFLDGFLLGLT